MKQTAYRERDHAFGQVMLTLRTAIGLTQARLADFLGISRRAVGGWEAGETYPKADHLQRLIELAVAERAFAPGREAEEIRVLWRAAHQKVLLDEQWLQVLLRPTSAPVAQQAAHTMPRHVPHNVPSMLTTCIGRALEIETITRLLGDPDCRLITVVGVGGIGKTRLALEAAWHILGDHAGGAFEDGVYFVPLADIDIPAEGGAAGADLFATTVADALNFALSGSDQPYWQVLRYLRNRRVLLVLDNLEHVLHIAPTIVALLQQAPALTILTTSRARLDVRGEQIILLDGLPYPAPGVPRLPDDSYAALKLFQHMASLHAPQLQWSAGEIAVAVHICAQVEGVPLAIELAASLVRLMPLHEIAAELAVDSAVLRASQRDIPPRHRSLRAVFDHSWRLLTPLEQRGLAELSVFRGGFDRDAARAVANADLPLIATLIDHSLVREAAPDTSIMRYSLHALVREYAADTIITEDPDAHAYAAGRHSRYYLGWLAARLPDLRNQRQQAAQAEIHREIDNIRAAWRWAVARSDILTLAAAGHALFQFCEMRSWFQEGAELLQLAAHCCEPLAAAGDDPIRLAWARLLACQGWLTFHLNQPDIARALLEQSLALLEAPDAPEDRVFTLNYLAAVTYHIGSYAEAERLAQAALDTSLHIGDQHGTAIAKTILGQIAYLTGAYIEARRWSLESLVLEQALGNRWGSVFTLISLGRVAVALEAYQDARRWFEQGLAIRDTMGDARGVGLCRIYLGDVAAALGEYSEAEHQYQASLSHFRLIQNSAGVATTLTKLGMLALANQEQQRAHHLLYEALGIAWAMQALPATLDALAGLADLLVDDEPARAAEVAKLVMHHPAAIQNSRQRASLVWERVAPQHPTPSPADAQHELVALMPQLLAPIG